MDDCHKKDITDLPACSLEELRTALYMRQYAAGKALASHAKQKIFKPHGLTIASVGVLWILSEAKGYEMSTQDLLKAHCATPSNISARVDFLVRGGLIERVEGKDRRSQSLKLTEKGVDTIKKVSKLHKDAMNDVYGHLCKDEVLDAIKVIDRLTSHL